MFKLYKRALLIALITLSSSLVLFLSIASAAQLPSLSSSVTPSTNLSDDILINKQTLSSSNLRNPLSTTGSISYYTYLPVIFQPPFAILGGEIKLTSDGGTMGVTTFDGKAVLDFSDLRFSFEPETVQVKQNESITFTNTVPISFTELITGANQINVHFTYHSATVTQTFTLFYIPNGNFAVTQTANSGPWEWEASDTSEINIGGGELVLGKESECSNASQAVATVSQNIYIPNDSNYYLNVEGTVHTQDQNPSNDGTYDAFEVVLDGHVVDRTSNPYSPISCTLTTRKVGVDAHISLSSYSGEVILSLENHLRFDDSFNTYTEITAVWIDR